MTREIRSQAESDEHVSVIYAAIPPRKRDFLRVLIGRYTPQVRRVERFTLKGFDREVRQAWSKEAIAAQFIQPPTLYEPQHDIHG